MSKKFYQFPTPTQIQIESRNLVKKTLLRIQREIRKGKRDFIILINFTDEVFMHLLLSDWEAFDIQTATNPADGLRYLTFSIRPIETRSLEKEGFLLLSERRLKKILTENKVKLNYVKN